MYPLAFKVIAALPHEEDALEIDLSTGQPTNNNNNNNNNYGMNLVPEVIDKESIATRIEQF